MSRHTSARVADIIDAIDRCLRYRQMMESSDHDLSEMATDAILRNIAIIGEAVNHLPATVTDATRRSTGQP